MASSTSEIDSNYRDAFAAFAKASGGIEKRFSGCTCFRSPIDYIEFNMAFIENESEVSYETLQQVQDFYREINAEWCLTVGRDPHGLFGKATKRIEISGRTGVPEMTIKRNEANFKRPPDALEVRIVEDLDGLEEWVATGERGFGMPTGFMKLLVRPQALKIPGLSFLLGRDRERNKPIATSAAFVSEGVAGVYAVSTVPAARSRGYGEAMTAAAARLGFDGGCEVSSLQSSQMGFPIYLRIGYRHIFDFQRWLVSRDANSVRKA